MLRSEFGTRFFISGVPISQRELSPTQNLSEFSLSSFSSTTGAGAARGGALGFAALRSAGGLLFPALPLALGFGVNHSVRFEVRFE